MIATLLNLASKKYALYLLFALFWLPIIVFGVLNINLLQSLAETDNIAYLERASTAQARSVEKFLNEKFEQVTAVSNTQSALKSVKHKSFTQLQTNDYNLQNAIFVTRIMVLDLKGKVRASSRTNDRNLDFKGEAYFTYALSDQKSQMILKTEDKIAPEIVFSAPVYGLDNQPKGVLAIFYSMTVFQEIVSTHRNLAGDGSYGIVLNHIEEVIASTNQFELDFNFLDSFNKELYRQYKIAEKHEGVFKQKNAALYVQNIGFSQWKSIYVQPKNSFVGSVQATKNNFIGILVIVFILAAISNYVTVLLVRRIRRRESELKKINDDILEDLKLGLQVQKALQYVPKLPQSIDFQSFQKAAKYVSGDLCFSYYDSQKNIFSFMIIDVNGKGVQAALKAAAFSSIAKSVWNSKDSYGEGRSRFDIFTKSANKFVKNTAFSDDFLAVLGCEYHIDDSELELYRLNYTSPFMVDASDSKIIQRVNIPNDKQVRIPFRKNQSIVMMGDAFVESSRSEKKIMSTLQEELKHLNKDIDSQQLTKMIREVPLDQKIIDDETIIILRNAS